MPSPDIKPYVNLTLNDKDPQDVFDASVLDLQTKLPEWIPREGNIEVMLLESMALEVAEAIFAVNRLPDGVVEALLKLFGILRDSGAPPLVNVKFTMVGTLGYTVPAGTQVRLNLPGGVPPVVFATNIELTVPPGSSIGTVAATGDRFTDEANNVALGTLLELFDSIMFVETVTLDALTTGGRLPEDNTTYFSRAVNRFGRLQDTLVLPKHFTAFALENPIFFRAITLDNYTPALLTTPTGVTATPFAAGGTLASGTYGYRVSAINIYGETLASATTSAVVTGPTGRVDLSWSAVAPAEGASPVTGYKVYGRTGGSELLIATTAAGTTTYSDTGSVTPSGALPAANTTGGAPGDFPGHVTVAVYGNGANATAQQKTDLEAAMEVISLANLDVHITDPTINTVAVTATVKALPGFATLAVQSAVEQALTGYLDPMMWDWGTVVRRNELITLVSNVVGVDYVDTMTVPATDVSLTGNAPLADAGTLTITVI